MKLIINNQVVHISEDWTILQACEKLGLFIPRFCYSETLSIAGNCRMCLIEIEKAPKLMPACAIKIANDMKIYTKTNLVKKTRESILEFLLINHPLDCPICDQGGECDLQDQAMIYGSDRGRFYEYKRSLEDKNKGPLIKTIMTRCIHCTRCIRFITEIAGIEMLGTTGRGKSMEIGSYISSLFNSELSGNVIDLCPVGALTSKPYAFTVRPWELKSIETIDVLDSIGSNIRIDIRGSELMRILPKSNNQINQQWISDKTRFAYDGLKNQRINYPMIRVKNTKKEYITQSWKQIIPFISTKLYTIAKKNPQNISGVIGQFIDQETILIFKRLMNQIGVESFNLFLQNPESKWNRNINIDFRSNYLLNKKLNAINESDYILLIGSTPRYEAALLNIRLRQIVIKKNLMITSIGFPTDLTYAINQLGNGMKILYQIVQGKHNALYKMFQAKNPIIMIGFNLIQREDGEAIKFMCNWLISHLEKTRHIIDIKNIEFERQSIKSVSCLHRISLRILNQSLSNTFLNIITFITKTKIKPAYKWKKIPNILKNKLNIKSTLIGTEFQSGILHTYASVAGAYDSNIGGQRPNYTNFKKYTTKQECIYLIGADFDINWEKRNKLNNKITKLTTLIEYKKPLIIYQGHHGDLGAKQADIILPSSSYVEKSGLYVNTEGRVQQSQTAIKLNGTQVDIRDDFMILQALSNFLLLNSINNHFVDNNVSWLLHKNITSIEYFINKSLIFIETHNQTHNKTPLKNKWIYQNNNAVKVFHEVKSNNNYVNYFFKYTKQISFLEKTLLKIYKMTIESNKVMIWEKLTFLSVINSLNSINNFQEHLIFQNTSYENKTYISYLFKNIAPHLNYPEGSFVISNLNAITTFIPYFKGFKSLKQYTLYNTSFTPIYDNFYLSDSISRASVIMGKCSTQFISHNFSF